MAANEPGLAIAQGAGRADGAADERRIAGLSLAAAYVIGEAYSIYAVFVAHSLRPVTFYLSEPDSFRRAVSGRYVEVFNLDGLMLTMVMSLIVFISVWCLFGSVVRMLSGARPATRVPWSTNHVRLLEESGR